MNWRKGFFRSWVLFSVFWVVGVGIATYQDDWQTYQDASHSMVKKAMTDEEFIAHGRLTEEQNKAINSARARLKITEMNTLKSARENLMHAGVAAIGVPAALLALGAMIAWVFSGFRKEQA